MRSIICVVLVCTIAVSGAADARKKPVRIPGGDATYLASYHPMPQYPPEAVSGRISGNGTIRLLVEIRTGRVIAAEVAQSTGSALLDNAGLQTLRRWRFKSEALRAVINKYDPRDKSPKCTVRIPIYFVFRR